ncbi:hypothetical protein Leryth_027459 [Lithospermum erythrorhizon]|uniref:Uncharacterized protein n=1 Tax=Lithospermum erythrorhizon TaxID=34254 RepID=A0AAV3Q2M8_LITER|nr:hypothetical protein Leryth_027459 [Lithospermum erythrorhizon]
MRSLNVSQLSMMGMYYICLIVSFFNTTIMKLSLWDQQVQHHGPILTSAAGRYSVIIAKRVRVKNYQGPTLSSTNVSSFIVDSPIEQVKAFKSWFESVNQVDLPNLLADNSIPRSKDLVVGNLVKKYLVGGIDASNKVYKFSYCILSYFYVF